MRREKTFTVRFNYFEPGSFVAPIGVRFLNPVPVCKVTTCWEPSHSNREACLFVEGVADSFPTKDFRDATKDEIASGEARAYLHLFKLMDKHSYYASGLDNKQRACSPPTGS